MWNFALKTLAADRGKLLTALVGVVFSVVLVNVQGGLFLGLIRKASLLIDGSNAHIWVGHRKMHNVDLPRDIPSRWVHRIRGIPGVKRAEPYLVGFGDMTLPSGGYEGVTIVGVEPSSLLGNVWNVSQGSATAVLHNHGIIVDEGEDEKLEYPQLGELREINGRRARIVSKSQGILGFLVAPYVFTRYENAAAYLNKPPNVCSYFLVQLEPQADREAVLAMVRRRLPELDAMTGPQYSNVSINFWVTRTGLGLSFGTATVLGLLVGLVMVAQALYALVLDRLGEFGTLKAIGATERQIFSILLSQSIVMAISGSLLGLLGVLLIQQNFSTPRVPIVVPAWLSAGSCLLVLGICLISSLLPYLRIRNVDPQMVLEG